MNKVNVNKIVNLENKSVARKPISATTQIEYTKMITYNQ